MIRSKREGAELAPSDIEFMVGGFLDGAVADYQMSAFLMAVFFRGMSDAETETLTRVMLRSGIVLDLSGVDGSKVDKHSTGGVGDKLSLIVAPVAAAAGVRIPMISGRGLGHTGGTLDKLESIPGMRTDFSPKAFVALVSSVGMAIVGQSPEMAPADRRMYALRDVTATVECVPLIVGSILSKKLAAGLDALVLDVKVGRGAFMGDVESARELARRLISTAGRLGLPTTALLTDMQAPLGLAVGNAIEVREALDTLRGGGPADVREVSLALAARMIVAAGVVSDLAAAEVAATSVLDDGSALEVFRRFVEAQGGDPSVVDSPRLLPEAPATRVVAARGDGYVSSIDALEIGLSAVSLGAGREAVGDEVDPSVGIEIAAPLGAEVRVGDALAVLHARTEGDADSVSSRVAGAFELSDAAQHPSSRIIEAIDQAPTTPPAR